MKHASGTFEVKVVPAEVSEIGKAGGVGRMTLDKVFHGSLEGTSKGEMLTGITASTGAMAYVAVETVTGKLDGHQGTFVLIHKGTMFKGDPANALSSITVVPGSGMGELAGLSGTMVVKVEGGQHHYSLAYELPQR